MNFFNIGPMELLMILVIVLIVFGPSKIPEIGASIGKTLRQFREASRDITNELNLEDLNPSTLVDALAGQAEAAESAANTDAAAAAAAASPQPPAEAAPAPAESAPAAVEAAVPPEAALVAAAMLPAQPPTPQRRRFLVSAPQPAAAMPAPQAEVVEAPGASILEPQPADSDGDEPAEALVAAVTQPAPLAQEDAAHVELA